MSTDVILFQGRLDNNDSEEAAAACRSRISAFALSTMPIRNIACVSTYSEFLDAARGSSATVLVVGFTGSVRSNSEDVVQAIVAGGRIELPKNRASILRDLAEECKANTNLKSLLVILDNCAFRDVPERKCLKERVLSAEAQKCSCVLPNVGILFVTPKGLPPSMVVSSDSDSDKSEGPYDVQRRTFLGFLLESFHETLVRVAANSVKLPSPPSMAHPKFVVEVTAVFTDLLKRTKSATSLPLLCSPVHVAASPSTTVGSSAMWSAHSAATNQPASWPNDSCNSSPSNNISCWPFHRECSRPAPRLAPSVYVDCQSWSKDDPIFPKRKDDPVAKPEIRTGVGFAQQPLGSGLALNDETASSVSAPSTKAASLATAAHPSFASFQHVHSDPSQAVGGSPLPASHLSDPMSFVNQMRTAVPEPRPSVTQHYLPTTAPAANPRPQLPLPTGTVNNHCHICDVDVSGLHNWDLHLKSEKHRRKEALKQAGGDTNLAARLINADNFFHCSVCNVTISGRVNVEQHLAGEKHLKRAAKVSGAQ